MPVIADLRDDLAQYLRTHGLWKKWLKAKQLFEIDPAHNSLHTELLKPKHRHIYSFRVDRNYRALFISLPDNTIEIISVTKHYHK